MNQSYQLTFIVYHPSSFKINQDCCCFDYCLAAFNFLIVILLLAVWSNLLQASTITIRVKLSWLKLGHVEWGLWCLVERFSFSGNNCVLYSCCSCRVLMKALFMFNLNMVDISFLIIIILFTIVSVLHLSAKQCTISAPSPCSITQRVLVAFVAIKKIWDKRTVNTKLTITRYFANDSVQCYANRDKSKDILIICMFEIKSSLFLTFNFRFLLKTRTPFLHQH